MRFIHSPLNSPVLALAVWLSAWTLQPLLADSSYMAQVGLVALVGGVLGALGALLRAPRMVTIAVQLAALVGLLAWRAGSDAALLPAAAGDEGPLRAMVLMARAGAEGVQLGTLPLDPGPGLLWTISAIVALVLVSLELLVNGLEQPAWGLAPLVLLYGIGALALPYEMGWRHFALVAVGYVGILLVTTGFGSGRRAGTAAQVGRFEGSRLVVGVALTALAGLVAVALTPAVPLAQKQPWLEAGSDAPIQLSDPTIKLNENLNRPDESTVLFYRTSTGEPTYLRTVALTRLSTSGAQLVPMQLATRDLSGTYDAPGERIETEVEMVQSSEYLPAPFAVDSFRAEGRWAHDPDTLAIVATGSDRQEQTKGLRYSVTSTLPSPSREELDAAAAGADPAGAETTRVPEGISPDVLALTTQVTALAESDGEKALAIQAFLRSEPFVYSLEAPQSTSLDAISSFLLVDRAGYCIHFAAAMVTMARIEGIPARMAVGFTPGEATEDGFVVTTHNMHTWPELFFEGLGWVPFEPTKSVAAPPRYTDPDTAPTDAPTATPSPTPTASPTPTGGPTPSPSPSPTTAPQDLPQEPGDSSAGWLLLLGVLLLAALPLLARTALRLWRLRPGRGPAETAASAWDEVRATFRDLGLEWDGRSPSLALGHLVKGLSPTSTTALTQIAGTVERARFARDGADVSALPAQVVGLRRDLLRTQSGSRQVRALFLPASLLGILGSLPGLSRGR